MLQALVPLRVTVVAAILVEPHWGKVLGDTPEAASVVHVPSFPLVELVEVKIEKEVTLRVGLPD